MKFKELEYKYKADKIKLSAFRKHVESIAVKPEWEEVSSWDTYFVQKDNKDDFVRYRYLNEKGTITSKEKTSPTNNQNRIEYNIELSNNKYDLIKSYHESKGYEHNFTIFKTCFIAWLDKVDIVYYITYNEEMEEIERFIEIECLEDYPWKDEKEAMDELAKWEQLIAPLGLVPQNKLRQSLFERYRK